MFADILKGIGVYILGLFVILVGLGIWIGYSPNAIAGIIGWIIIILGAAFLIFGKKIVSRA